MYRVVDIYWLFLDDRMVFWPFLARSGRRRCTRLAFDDLGAATVYGLRLVKRYKKRFGGTMDLHAHLEPRFTGHGPGYVLRLFERHGGNGEVSVVTDLIFKTFKENESIKPVDDLIISQGTAQELLDWLWAFGLRPSKLETLEVEPIAMPDMPLYGELLEIVKRQIELSSRLMTLVDGDRK